LQLKIGIELFMEGLMRGFTSFFLVVFFVSFDSEASSKKLTSLPKAEKSTLVAQARQSRLPKRNEGEVSQLKLAVSESGSGLSLRQKIRALTRLAEVEGQDITDFLLARRNQLESEIKSAPPAIAKELKDFRYAIEKILNMRDPNRYASVE
jgi:hypothetical protein